MQVATNASMLQTMQNMYRSDGVRSFYRGSMAMALREVPYTCIEFTLYESLLSWWRTRSSNVGFLHKISSSNTECLQRIDADSSGSLLMDHTSSWMDSAVCGCIAGAITGAVTTPLDVIKTRMMLDSTAIGTQSIAATTRCMFVDCGWRPFVAGIWPRSACIAAGGFVFFGVYDYIKTSF